MGDMPSEAECAAFTTLQELKVDCEVNEEVWLAFETLTGELGVKLRSLANLQPSVIMYAVKEIRVKKDKDFPDGT